MDRKYELLNLALFDYDTKNTVFTYKMCNSGYLIKHLSFHDNNHQKELKYKEHPLNLFISTCLSPRRHKLPPGY